MSGRHIKCHKCKVEMVPGKALQNTAFGIPDFIGDDQVVTVSETGPARMVDVLKCPECGRSIAGNFELTSAACWTVQ